MHSLQKKEPRTRSFYCVAGPGSQPEPDQKGVENRADHCGDGVEHKGFLSEMQERSLIPLLSGSSEPEWRDAIYYHYYEFSNEHMVKRHYGIRTDRYKLIHFYNDIDEWELYDLKNDPHEMHNLIHLAEHAALIENLKTELTRLQVQYDDTDHSTY